MIQVKRLKRVKHDGVFVSLVVSVKYTASSGRTASTDFALAKHELTKPITKASLKADIKGYLLRVLNQTDIDLAVSAGQEPPAPITTLSWLKTQTEIPVVTYDEDFTLINDNEIGE